MKKIFYIIACATVALSAVSCQGFLESKDPGIVDKDFVFSSTNNTFAAMKSVYSSWISCADGTFYGNGLFYAVDLPGGDDSRHPEGYANQLPRHQPEGFYENGAITGSYNLETYGSMSSFYSGIAKANNVINAMQESEAYKEYMKDGAAPTELSQLYGEAVCARATLYAKCIKYYGDIPYTTKSGVAASGMTSRDSIYDCIIADLERVAPHMYAIGEVPGYGTDKCVFSRTFAEAMAGVISLEAAGYQTRRDDFKYLDGEGKEITFEKIGKPNANAQNAFYGRRSDYKKFYEKAQTHFKYVIDNPGSAKIYTKDPRSNGDKGQIYDNPHQYFFQQTLNNDIGYADESIFEYALTWNVSNGERPYSNGRVSNGGSSNAFPCKAYGQGRINPAWYWGVFDPNDKRRDVACTVTGSTGAGAEKLIPFAPNSKTNGGGVSNNKWDENRQNVPCVLKQRRSGVNGPFLRMAEVYLGYAEACAALGNDGEAKKYLAIVRERSFPEGKANTDAFIASCGSMFKAVIAERGFEFCGEGDRRWTLIRTGLVGENVKRVKELQKAMIDGVKKDGFYKFENGNEFPAYVWTKLVDAKKDYGYRLTTQTPAGKENDPVLYPGWRGQNDDWAEAAAAAGCTNLKGLTAGDKTNLAIAGLFKHIEPDSPEAKALEADGYAKVKYGLELAENETEYVDNFFKNYDYESAPIYLLGFNANSLLTINGLTNGYGFSNTTK